jgi:hypothetical protein
MSSDPEKQWIDNLYRFARPYLARKEGKMNTQNSSVPWFTRISSQERFGYLDSGRGRQASL